MTFLRGNPPCVRQIREGAARGVNRTRNSAMLVADSANSVKAPFLGPPNGSGGGNHGDSQSCVGLGSSAPSASHRSAAPWSAADPTNSARRSGALASPPGTHPTAAAGSAGRCFHAVPRHTQADRTLAVREAIAVPVGPRYGNSTPGYVPVFRVLSRKRSVRSNCFFENPGPVSAANTHGRGESRCSASCPLSRT